MTSKKNLIAIIDNCYAAACEAKLHGCPMIMHKFMQRQPDGADVEVCVMDNIRTTLFLKLLDSELPRTQEITTRLPPEKWQE